jgi:hypothetical protein
MDAHADVAKLVDAVDSKSTSSNRMLVRVLPSAKELPERGAFFVLLQEVWVYAVAAHDEAHLIFWPYVFSSYIGINNRFVF